MTASPDVRWLCWCVCGASSPDAPGELRLRVFVCVCVCMCVCVCVCVCACVWSLALETPRTPLLLDFEWFSPADVGWFKLSYVKEEFVVSQVRILHSWADGCNI